MDNETTRKHLPPYISYRTFRNFTTRLQQQIPNRIDRSYWGDMLSGSTGTQLMAALRFLNLIDTNGKPSNRLRALVPARADQQVQLLREMTTQAYDFILQGTLDLQNATYGQLEEAFHSNFQLTPDVCRKCMKFFISMATDARIQLSPFVTRRVRLVYGRNGTTIVKNGTKRTRHKSVKNSLVPQILDEVPERASWQTTLLDKFPTFDPGWNDEVKTKWFVAFDELLRLYPQKQNNDK